MGPGIRMYSQRHAQKRKARQDRTRKIFRIRKVDFTGLNIRGINPLTRLTGARMNSEYLTRNLVSFRY
jgi:hypothetical protein